MVLYPGCAQLVPGAAARGAEFDTHSLLWILPWPAAPAWGTASNPTVARPTRVARIKDHLLMLTPFARVDACRSPEFPPTAPHHPPRQPPAPIYLLGCTVQGDTVVVIANCDEIRLRGRWVPESTCRPL